MDTESQQPESPPPLSTPPTAASEADEPTEEIAPETVTAPMWPRGPMPLSVPPTTPMADTPAAGAAPPPFPPPPPSPPPPPPFGDWYYGATPLPASAPPRRHPGRAVAVLMLVALLAGGLGAGLGVALSAPSPTSPATVPVPSAPPPTSAPSAPSSAASSAIARAVDPAVVDIDTEVASGSAAAGTGIIVAANGEVLTNNHVVDEASAIRIVTENNGTHTGRVVAVDPTLDIALVQIEGLSGSVPHATLGNSSDVKVGDPVTAIGNAYGLGGSPSVVTGAISAMGQSITADDALAACGEQLSNLLQTTAPIASGDSGGPLLNAAGQVIGMDTAAESGNNASPAGFAIPINEARNIVSEMQAGDHTGGIIYGLSAFLGVETAPQCSGSSQPSQNLGGGGFGIFGGGFGNSGSANSGSGNSGGGSSVSGVQIEGVVNGGPAQTAGLEGGDVITALGGVKVTSANGLKQAVVRFRPGQTVSVSYVDGSGTAHTTTAHLEGIPE